MGKRILMWIIPFVVGLFACQEGYWVFGWVMLCISVAYTLLWAVKVFREWKRSEMCIGIINGRNIINVAIVTSIFVVAERLGFPWIGWVLVASIVFVRILKYLLKKAKEEKSGHKQ